MATEQKKQSFTAAMKNYFGFKPGQTVAQFAAELKELDHADKMYYHAGLVANGIDCDPPANPAAA